MKSYKQILEDSYASDYKVKKFLGPDGKWQERKLRPHRVDFKASKMRGEPAQDDDRGDVGMKEEKTTGATKLVHTRTGANGAKYHIMQDSPTDYSIHREHKGKTTHIDTYGSLHRAKSVLDNEVKEETNMTIDEQINEVLSKDATAGDWIHDFVHSDNPKFEGKSKDKRKQMALAAYYAKQRNEEVEIDENAPVAPVPDKKYIKGTPEHKAYKATKKPINGMPTNVKERSMKSFKEMVQTLDEVNQKTVALAKEIAKKHKNMTSDVSRGNVHIFNKHDDEAADRLVLAHTGTDKEGNDRFHLHRVHSSAEDSDHRNLTAAEVHKHAARHITGKSMDEEVESIEEKSEQAKQNKTMKNMMDASRGARYKLNNPVPPADPEHKTAQAHNKAIGRALRNEAKDESEYGYEGDMAMTQLKTMCRHAEEFMGMLKPDTDLPEWVQSKITLATDYIQTAHDYMSSEMNEELKGSQHKLDKNKNGKVDSHDFKILRGEVCTDCGKSPCECGTVKESDDIETRNLSFKDFISQLNEYTPGPGGVTRVQGRSYGAQYRDPEGEDDADDKKKQVAKPEPAVKRGRGRPAGSKSGANQKVTTGKKGSGVDYTGYKLHLPNSNR